MAITSIGSGSTAVLLSSGGTAQQQITSVVVPRVPGSVPAGQASRLVQLADVNAVSLPGGVLTEVVGPGGERRFEIRDDLQTQISVIYDAGSGNAVLQNATYENGVLSYTGGTINGSPAMTMIFPLSVAGEGLLTMPSGGSQWLLYVSVISGSQLPMSLPALAMTASSGAIGLYDTGYQVAPGTAVPLQWTDHSISAHIDGEWRTLSGDTLNDPHVLVFEVSGGALAPVPIAVTGLVAGAGASGLLLQEIDDRQAADAALAGQIADKANQYALDALAQTVADVQTLAEVNQLNITGKADQADLETLQTTVTGQGLTLAQKADQTALDALGTVVSGKATPADITAAIAALVDGAPDALNTLAELATALAGEQAQIADLLTALALRVRVDAVQSLTLAQQLQARQNINAEAVGVAAGLVAAITPASIGAATAVQGAKADTALQSADVAPVALSGQYSALLGLPTIPGLSSDTPEAPTTGGTAGTATTAVRGDHAHPLPTSAQITAAALTGLATGSNAAIAAADTLLQALEKLQAQASANAELLAPVPRKIGPSWYVSGSWYDAEYPRFVVVSVGTVVLDRVFYIPRQILENATFTSLSFYCSTAAAGAVAYAGIYSDNNGQPDSLLASFSADCSTTGVKSGSISLSLSAGQVVWDAFVMTGGAAQMWRYAVTRALPEQLGSNANSVTFRLKNGPTGLSATATGTSPAQANVIPRLLLQRA